MPTSDQLEAILAPIAEEMGGFLVEIAIRGSNSGKVVEIFADTDAGITTEECAALSRRFAEKLDTEELITGRYHLVVSSPGVDRPLRFLRQYPRNIGRRMEVLFRENGETLRCDGTLVEAASGSIGIRTGGEKGEIRRIALEAIVEAKVRTPW